MAPIKRGDIWYADFCVDGKRFRPSLKSKDWREALRRERELIQQASEGKLAAKKNGFALLSFSEAAEQFLLGRIPSLAERSVQTERERVKPINAYVGNTQVSRITVEQVQSYALARNTAGRSNATINRELDVIRGVLKKAKRWHIFAGKFVLYLFARISGGPWTAPTSSSF